MMGTSVRTRRRRMTSIPPMSGSPSAGTPALPGELRLADEAAGTAGDARRQEPFGRGEADLGAVAAHKAPGAKDDHEGRRLDEWVVGRPHAATQRSPQPGEQLF